MTTHDTQAGNVRHEAVRAGEADIGVLSQVIAEAFFPLAVCRWLIPDGTARRAAFPAYFRLYLQHAIADGIVETTPGRDAAALWIPGDGPAEPPGSYKEQLAAITGPHLDRVPGIRPAARPAPPGRSLPSPPGHPRGPPGPAGAGHRHRAAGRPPRRT